MTISYKWLSEYLPLEIEPEKLSSILTAVGLEVESLERYEGIPGGLKGLIVGQVILCEKHPEADKLKITKVAIGETELQIVCGASNVATGQKVIVAPIGSVIYPINGEPVTMKKAKIRGVESFGMICAEDEVGLGSGHEGILVLPEHLIVGSLVSDHFKPQSDWIFEIGLTPNRMDAMSHLGVAKDVCAWYSHHHGTTIKVKYPKTEKFSIDHSNEKISVSVPDSLSCPRYSGICLSGLKVKPSPQWLVERLKSIGLKSINNIVDSTNFILHESGQPLHAFDLEKIKDRKIIVKKLSEGTPFISLDGKNRQLGKDDVMICNGSEEPMCIGGVFGGLESGVSEQTTSVFLESANFNSTLIRKTLLRHGLRTDAAIRFEKGVDISKTVDILKRAALLIKEIAGGEISSEIIDIYPQPKSKTEIILGWDFLKKISGKDYSSKEAGAILESLGFEVIHFDEKEIKVKVPFSNPDISIPVDLIEEIMRIDGLDNIPIPNVISIAPSIEKLAFENALKEKVATLLTGNGFAEILTNSITNSAYYNEEELYTSVKIINSLSVELDVMKPQMLHTALECIAYNLNRKNNELFLFEFGKTYAKENENYKEQEHLVLFISSTENSLTSWRGKAQERDLFYLKGLCEKIVQLAGISGLSYSFPENNKSDELFVNHKKIQMAAIRSIPKNKLHQFSIKQPVFAVDFNWQELIRLSKNKNIKFEEISKYPVVQRELSIVVDRTVPYEHIEKVTKKAGIQRLSSTSLLNVFESDKLGKDKKSFALRYTFFDKEKTMVDKEIDNMMTRLMDLYENELQAQIRRS